MPVIARQCWRFGSFVQSQSGHLRQAREPLPFLCPRWFATASPAQDTSASTTETGDQDDGKRVNAVRDKGLVRRLAVDDEREKATSGSNAKPVRIPDTKPTSRLVKGLAHHNAVQKQKETRRRQLRLAFTDAEDWRAPFSELLKHTPSDSKEHGKQVERLSMPKGTRGSYLGNPRELVLETMLLTGCHVQIVSEDEQAIEGFDSIVLAGTPASIRLAKKRLDEVVSVVAHGDSDEHNQLGAYSVDSVAAARPELVRAVWNQNRYPDATHSAEDASLPRVWTIISFANYVEDIVKSRMSRLTRRKVYDSAATPTKMNHHTESIKDILVKLFCDPEMLPVISSSACSMSMEFLMKHRKFPEARQIFQTLDSHGFEFQPDVFHMFMRAASYAQDLHNYTFALRLMLNHNLTPTWETWTALINIVAPRSIKDARQIAHSMRAKGLLVNPAAKMALAQAFVTRDYSVWIARGNTTDAFFSHYDRAWGGPEWLTDSCANRMLAIKANRGQMNAASRILDELEARGRHANVASLNQLLTSCAQHGNVTAAVAFATRLLGTGSGMSRIVPDKTTFRQLFVLAWQRRRYNLLRVVWRYACMSGHVDHDTQTAMEDHVVSYAPVISHTDVVSHGESFRAYAAKVAVGLVCEVPTMRVPESLRQSLGERIEATRISETQLRELLKNLGVEKKPRGNWDVTPEQLLRRRTLLGFVKADMGMVGKLRPVEPLHELLAKALRRDKELEATGREVNIESLLDQAIDVPVTRSRRKGWDTGHRVGR